MRLWLKSADGKSSVAAAVSDLNNGSYVGEALLKWPGVTLVRVSLTYPVEYLRALTEMFHTVHTLRWITDIFDDGKGSQEVGLAGTVIAQFLERRTRDRMGRGFESPLERRENLSSSPGSTFCSDSYFGIRSTPRITAVARKRPRSFCRKRR